MLGIPGGNAAPVFELQEGVLDQMSMTVERDIIRPGRLAVLARGNDHRHPLVRGLLDDGRAVIATIGQQVLGAQACDQGPGLGAVGRGAGREQDAHRHAVGINSEMQLAVEPPFVTPMA